MAKNVLQSTILSANGGVSIAPGAQIEVRNPDGQLVPLWLDRDGTQPTSNPFTADSNGFFRVYLDAGRYHITASKDGQSQEWRDVLLGSAAGYDVGTEPDQVPTNEMLAGTIGAGGIAPDAPGDTLGNGGWCWFADPRAVRHVGTHDRTYYTYVEPDYATGDSHIVIASIDHTTGARARFVLETRAGRTDDHDAGAILVLADGRIAVFWPLHSGAPASYRISINPEDISAFGPTQTTPGTAQVSYPNPVMLSAEANRVYLFFVDRTVNRDIRYFYSDDQCQSWSGPQHLIAGRPEFAQGVYFKASTNGTDRVDLVVTGAIGPRDEPKRDVRHCYFAGETLYAANGAPLASRAAFPLAFDSMPVVYDSAAGNDVWVWDCSTNNGNPQIVYAEFAGPNEHYYRYARWSGDQWVDRRLSVAGSYIAHGSHPGESRSLNRRGEGFYSPGIALSHDTDGVVYLSIGNAERACVQRWESSDGGATWRYRDVSADDLQSIRPVVPRNAHPDVPVLWLEGRYRHWTRFGMSVVTAPTGTVRQPRRANRTLIRAGMEANQRITGGDGFTLVALNRIYDGLDTKSEFNPVSHSITIQDAGVYLLTLRINATRTAAGQTAAEVRRNGTRFALLLDLVSSGAISLASSTIAELSPGDVLDVRVLSNGGDIDLHYQMSGTPGTMLEVVQLF